MSLELTKYREASHERFAVGGSYTDTWLEVQGRSDTSNNAIKGGYVRWVPNDKSGTGYYPGVSYNTGFGYNQFDINDGFWLLKFNYYDDTNTYNGGTTSPGIRLTSAIMFDVTSSGMDELASQLTSLGQASGDFIYVLVSGQGCVSSSALNTQMVSTNKSWRFATTKASSTTFTNHSYAAIGTNVNSIGYLSESIAGTGSNHIPAFAELVIEHKRTSIGHAGYGEELSSGIGMGASGDGVIWNDVQKEVYWANDGRYNVAPNEYIRATWEQKVGQGARQYGGGILVELKENTISTGASLGIVNNSINGASSGFGATQSPISQTVDGWHKQEIKLARNSTSTDTKATISINPSSGSGVGVGFQYMQIKNLQVFKSGFDPDLQRDAAIHKYHANGRNINESPGPFNIGDPAQFVPFWDGARNLLGNTTSYTSDFSNTTISSTQPRSFQFKNASTSSYGQQGQYNWIQFFDRSFFSVADSANSQTYGWVKETWDSISNHTKSYELGSGIIPVNHNKVYLVGVWVRVRENIHTNTTLAPNRISMVAHTYDSNNNAISSTGTGSSLIADGQNYQQSIYADKFGYVNGSGYQNWKLINGFYLPSWMTAAERLEWKDNYWGQWAGHFEHGSTPDDNMSGITGYGLNAATAGYVCGMTSSTTGIRPELRIEQYNSTTLWSEFMYPFLIEIDPLNIDDQGDVWFWDFTENLPA